MLFRSQGDRGFHLVAIDVDGSEDISRSWLDTRDVTQYSSGADTYNNNHFPRYLQFGGSGTSNGYSTCEIAEFLAFNKVLSEEERQRVEGYLGHRWRNSVSFPSNHNYSDSPPDWSPSEEASLQAWFDANDSSSINPNYVKNGKTALTAMCLNSLNF